MTITDIILWAFLLVGVGGVFYVFYKILAGGFKALRQHDD